MIRSMTGFGESEIAIPAGRLRVELRTVNHRYLNVNARLPTRLARWEPDIREWMRRFFTRGHVNCTVRLDRDESALLPGIRLDPDRVRSYLAIFDELRADFGVSGESDLALLTRFNDVFVREDVEDDGVEISADDLRAAIDAAAEAVVVMRSNEGQRLASDLEGRFVAIEEALQVVAAIAPTRLDAERDRLRAVVRELSDGVGIDPARLAQEVALLAERWDIHEELVRFASHLELARALIDGESSEGVGKRLSFLVQEMHREANTIGSKANNAEIAHRVVAIKEEVERLREQVENVE